jgi:hypothetical protein
MLFVNQRGYVHLEPTIVICTVVVIVDIAASQQHIQAISLLPQMMSANNGRGREPKRSAVPSPLLPDCNNVPLVPSSFGVAPPMATAVVGGCHCSLVIVPLLRTIAVIVLVLLLPPERTPILNRDSRQRRATYDNDGGPTLILACGLSLLSARRQGQSASIHPLPPSASWQHRRCDLHHVQCPLEVACVRITILPSFYALFDFFPIGIAMIVQPHCWHSNSPPLGQS